jgi:hypothetical protein
MLHRESDLDRFFGRTRAKGNINEIWKGLGVDERII